MSIATIHHTNSALRASNSLQEERPEHRTNAATDSRTWEEAIKFDSGLSYGRHCIELEHADGSRRVVLVEITRRKVLLLAKPRQTDMYSSWMVVKGNALEHDRKLRTIVWGAHDAALMSAFDNPTAVVRKSR